MAHDFHWIVHHSAPSGTRNDFETSFTDFQPVKLGKWNKADPTYVPQYAAFFLMLSEERVDQQRSFISVFELIESWGASICFFYLLFRLLCIGFLLRLRGAAHRTPDTRPRLVGARQVARRPAV